MLCSADSVGASETEREARIKAAVMYYLVKFIEWPTEVFQSDSSPFGFCIGGEDSIGPYVKKALAKKRVRGRSIDIRLLDKSLDSSGEGCNAIYYSKEFPSQKEGLANAISANVLTISSEKDITADNGMVFLYEESNKVRIKISLSVTKSAKLKVSSELLNIAEVVE